MQKRFFFGKRFFDDFENKLALEKALQEGLNPKEIAVKFNISHQLIRDELYKGIPDEVDYIRRRYTSYSAKLSRKKDLAQLLEFAEQFKREIEE